MEAYGYHTDFTRANKECSACTSPTFAAANSPAAAAYVQPQ